MLPPLPAWVIFHAVCEVVEEEKQLQIDATWVVRLCHTLAIGQEHWGKSGHFWPGFRPPFLRFSGKNACEKPAGLRRGGCPDKIQPEARHPWANPDKVGQVLWSFFFRSCNVLPFSDQSIRWANKSIHCFCARTRTGQPPSTHTVYTWHVTQAYLQLSRRKSESTIYSINVLDIPILITVIAMIISRIPCCIYSGRRTLWTRGAIKSFAMNIGVPYEHSSKFRWL